jgi:hypothetical protein
VEGCTTTFLGVLGCTEVGILQLLGCTIAVLGAFAGFIIFGLAQLLAEGNMPGESTQPVI